MAALLTIGWGLGSTEALLGGIGLALGILELVRRGNTRLPAA